MQHQRHAQNHRKPEDPILEEILRRLTGAFQPERV